MYSLIHDSVEYLRKSFQYTGSIPCLASLFHEGVFLNYSHGSKILAFLRLYFDLASNYAISYGKTADIFETRNNLGKICKTDFKSLKEILRKSLSKIFCYFIMISIYKLYITYILFNGIVKQTIYVYY
jgi:hypothetical protein